MSKPRILIVDDEESVLASLKRSLRKEDLEIVEATSAQEALKILSQDEVALVLSDHWMPDMKGADFLRMIRDEYPDIVRIILTGDPDIAVAEEAVNKGEIYKFITKPWNDSDLRATIRLGLSYFEMVKENKRLAELTRKQNLELTQFNRELEKRVASRTRALNKALYRLNRSYFETILALAEAIELKDPYTRGHSERVSIFAVQLAKRIELPKMDQEKLRLAGILHDVGKVAIDSTILTKPAKLTPEEYEIMKKHPVMSVKIIEPIDFLVDIRPIIRHHHERYDGKGYPDGLSGDDIPLGSRILAVADTVEAMTSDRAYRKARGIEEVIAELERCSGSQFDPALALAFINILKEKGLPLLSERDLKSKQGFLWYFLLEE
jgi:putative nucleotidyltransferase with HDIG domain